MAEVKEHDITSTAHLRIKKPSHDGRSPDRYNRLQIIWVD